MNDEKLKMYLTILNSENPSHVKENAKANIIILFEKEQKEIKKRLKEIDDLYKMMSAKDDEIEELKHFKEEVSDIIEDAYYTAEPTYCKIKKLLGE